MLAKVLTGTGAKSSRVPEGFSHVVFQVLARILGGALWLFSLDGCRRGPQHRVISVIPRQASESTWVNEHAGVNEAAIREGFGIYWSGPSEDGDVEQQVILAERAISSGNMGLIVSPSNPFALNTVVQRSVDHGMSVVILGDPISIRPEKRLSFVLNDSQETGRLAAVRLRDRLKGKGDIMILGYDSLFSGSNDRFNAFEGALRREAPGVLVTQKVKGPFSFGEAELAVEKAIRANPHLSGIFSLSTTATRGAVAAVRMTRVTDRILIVGCDHTLDLLYLLRQGSVDALVAQDMRAMGSMAVESIASERRGGMVEPYRYIKPVLLTRENIDEDRIQAMLRMDWRPK